MDRYKRYLEIGSDGITSSMQRRLNANVNQENQQVQDDVNPVVVDELEYYVQNPIEMQHAPFHVEENVEANVNPLVLHEFENIEIPVQIQDVLLHVEQDGSFLEVNNGEQIAFDLRDAEDADNDLRDLILEIDTQNENLIVSNRAKSLQDLIEDENFLRVITARVDINKGEVMLMLLKYCVSNYVSFTGMKNLFQLVNIMFEESVLPDTRYSLDKLFNQNDNVEFHALCHNCSAYVGKFGQIRNTLKQCTVCEAELNLTNPSNISYFIIIDPSVRISNLLQINEVYYDDVMTKRRDARNSISDIYDGNAYREFVSTLPNEVKKNYVTAILNTDGAPKFKCSQFSIWPIYLMLNELPPDKRMNNLITCGLWFHKQKPEMTVFLNCLVDVINNVSDGGINCTIKGEERCIKLYILVCCVDSVARAPMQGVKQYNGKFGCNWCLHPGFWKLGSMRYPILDYTPAPREKESTIADMFEATPENPINGIKYPSALINLRSFNIISGFVPDYMHCILEGVATDVTEYYLKSMQVNKDEILRLDSIMQNISVPNQITRLTRPFSSRSDWKSREWENFILYYSIPLYKNILDNKFLQHWLLLVESLFLLLQDKISIYELDKADRMLHEFVVNTEKYFGVQAMNYNVHQLLHLSQSVLDWGPLWTHSTFPFESENYRLLRAIKCARGVTQQVLRFIHINHSISILEDKLYPNISTVVKKYCSDVLSAKAKHMYATSEITYIGKVISIDESIINNLNLSKEHTKVYLKIIKNGCLYASSLLPNRRSNNSYAQLHDETFVQIISFIVDTSNNKEFFSCKRVAVRDCCVNKYNNLKTVQFIEDEAITVDTARLKRICVLVEVRIMQYIISVPNLLHY